MLMAVPVNAQNSFVTGTPTPLFQWLAGLRFPPPICSLMTSPGTVNDFS